MNKIRPYLRAYYIMSPLLPFVFEEIKGAKLPLAIIAFLVALFDLITKDENKQ